MCIHSRKYEIEKDDAYALALKYEQNLKDFMNISKISVCIKDLWNFRKENKEEESKCCSPRCQKSEL